MNPLRDMRPTGPISPLTETIKAVLWGYGCAIVLMLALLVVTEFIPLCLHSLGVCFRAFGSLLEAGAR